MHISKSSNRWVDFINCFCQQRRSLSNLLILYALILILIAPLLSGCPKGFSLGEGREESYQECYHCDDLDCVPPAEEIRYNSPEIVEIEMIVEGI